MKVFWCRSHLVWLVLRVESLHALVFIQKTFVTCFCYFFVLLFRKGKREGRGEDAQSIKYV